jgi:hypothetical protein
LDYREVLTTEAADVLLYGMRKRQPDVGEEALQLLGDLVGLRTQQLDRMPLPLDLEVMASILCWWPLKTPPPPQFENGARELRTYLLDRFRRFGRIDDVVQDNIPLGLLQISADQAAIMFYDMRQ